MTRPSRRTVLAVALSAAAASPAWGALRRLRLGREGAARVLPDQLFGLELAADSPVQDPAFAAALKAIAPSFLRTREATAVVAESRPFTGLMLHQVTRTLLGQLANPQVTTSTWPVATVLRRNPHGDYVTINAGDVVSWVFRAARGPGALHQRLTGDGDVAASVLRQGARRTVLVQNANPDARGIDLSSLLRARTRILAECVETPDLTASLEVSGPAHGQLMLDDRLVTVPPWSVTRIVWDA